MKLTHSLKIVLLFAFASLQMVSMEPIKEEKPTKFIFDAIGYYEQGEYEKAAQIFKRYAGKPVPVAEPFCLDLVSQGLLPPFDPIPSNEEVQVKARAHMWFTAARQFPRWKDKSMSALFNYLEKSDVEQNGALLYLIGTLFEMGTQKCPVNKIIAKQFYIRALNKNDWRAASKIKNLCSIEEFEGMKKGDLPLLKVHNMLSLMPKIHQDEAYIFAGLSCFFQNSPPQTYPYYLYAAALFGHAGAQFEVGKAYCESESKILYWLMHSAEQGNLDALRECGDMMEKSQGTKINDERAYYYRQRAAHHSEATAIDFANLGLMHEAGKGTPVNYETACEWYKKGYEADPSNQELIYQYGKMLFILNDDKFTTVLSMFDKNQNWSNEATYNYARMLTKLAPDRDVLPEVIEIWSQLASEGYLPAACDLIDLVREGKGSYDHQTLLSYKGYIENAIQKATLEEKTQSGDEELSRVYNALRNLYFKEESLFSQEGIGRIDLSEKAFQFNPLNQSLEFVYAQDLKDNGQYEAALNHFISLQNAKLPVMLEIGCCYDHWSEEIQVRNLQQSLTYSQLALEYYQKQLAEDGDSLAKANASFNIYSLYFRKKIDYLSDEEIVRYLTVAAEGEDGEALNHLGIAYMCGCYSLTSDRAKAEQLFRKSICQDNNKEAKMNLMSLLYTNVLPETIAEATQLYDELLREHPKELKEYLEKITLSVQNVLDESEQEGSGEETKEEKGGYESGQQESKDDQPTSESLTSSSSTEEEYPTTEEGWKKWKAQNNTTTTSLQLQQALQQSVVLSKQERRQREEQNRLQRKYERMMRKVEALKGVKQAKYRKIQTLMGQHMQAFGGGVKGGKGSGRRIELGGTHSGFHQPHGSNGTEIDRGALNSLTILMQGQDSKG